MDCFLYDRDLRHEKVNGEKLQSEMVLKGKLNRNKHIKFLITPFADTQDINDCFRFAVVIVKDKKSSV